MMNFEAAVGEGSLLLTDGGIETRIMFETDVPLPEHVQVAALVTDLTGGLCCVVSTRATSPPPARSDCR